MDIWHSGWQNNTYVTRISVARIHQLYPREFFERLCTNLQHYLTENYMLHWSSKSMYRKNSWLSRKLGEEGQKNQNLNLGQRKLSSSFQEFHIEAVILKCRVSHHIPKGLKKLFHIIVTLCTFFIVCIVWKLEKKDFKKHIVLTYRISKRKQRLQLPLAFIIETEKRLSNAKFSGKGNKHPIRTKVSKLRNLVSC